jgi:hypothetical protein
VQNNNTIDGEGIVMSDPKFTDNDLKRNEPTPNKRIKASERWANSFDKIPDGCWNWKAVIGSNGYGRFWFNGKLWLAPKDLEITPAGYEEITGFQWRGHILWKRPKRSA